MAEDYQEDVLLQEEDNLEEQKGALYNERLKMEALLKGSDYKVVKCAEAQLSGVPLPYDQQELHAQRAAWRNRINEIDAELDVLDGKEISEETMLAIAKAKKCEEIDDWNVSANVNVFTVGGAPMWLNFELRTRLNNSLAALPADTESMSKWFAGREYTFTVAAWKQMLNAVENYAGECQNVSDAHKAAVDGLTSIEAVESYDYTVGYPEKLTF